MWLLIANSECVVAVNKMDLVDFSEEIFNTIKKEYEDIAKILKLKNVIFIPISARDGDNVVDASDKHLGTKVKHCCITRNFTGA